MEGFSLVCSSCQAKLRVRERSLIGQVVDCPKCANPILVKAPANLRPGREEEITVTDSMAIPEEPVGSAHPPGPLGGAFDEIDALLSASAEPPPPMPRTSASHPAPAQPSISVAPPSVPRKLTSTKSNSNQSAKLAPSATPQPTPPTGNPPSNDASHTPHPPTAESSPPSQVEPPPVERSPSTRRNPYVVLAASIFGGVLLAAAAVVVLVNFITPPEPSPQDATAIAQAESAATTSSTEQKQPAIEESPAAETAAAPPAAEAEPPAAATATQEPPAIVKAADGEKVPEAATNDADPLGIATDPLAEASPAVPAVAKTTTPKAPLANPLADFGKLLGDDGPLEEEAPAAAPLEAETPEAPAVKPAVEEPAPQPILPRPTPRVVDVAARLKDPLPGIELTDAPLGDFLQVMSDLSTIPITLQPDILPFLKVTPKTAVSSKLTKTTVGGALDEVLKPLGLATEIRGQQLIVRPLESEPGKLLKKTISVADLAAGDESEPRFLAEEMAKLIDPTIWQVPDDPEAAKGAALIASKDGIAVQAPYSTYVKLYVLGEKLRVARHLPIKSKFPPAMFDITTRSQAITSKLAVPVTLNFSQPTLLVKILPRLEAATKLSILVDWESVADSGWNPDGEAVLVSEGIPAKEALSKMLEPMELTYRVVDAQTLQIVSRQTLSRTLDFEIHPVEKLLKSPDEGPALVSRAEASFPEGVLTSTGGQGHLTWDEKSQSILASLTQTDQETLSALLQEWATPPNPVAPTDSAAK